MKTYLTWLTAQSGAWSSSSVWTRGAGRRTWSVSGSCVRPRAWSYPPNPLSWLRPRETPRGCLASLAAVPPIRCSVPTAHTRPDSRLTPPIRGTPTPWWSRRATPTHCRRSRTISWTWQAPQPWCMTPGTPSPRPWSPSGWTRESVRGATCSDQELPSDTSFSSWFLVQKTLRFICMETFLFITRHKKSFFKLFYCCLVWMFPWDAWMGVLHLCHPHHHPQVDLKVKTTFFTWMPN